MKNYFVREKPIFLIVLLITLPVFYFFEPINGGTKLFYFIKTCLTMIFVMLSVYIILNVTNTRKVQVYKRKYIKKIDRRSFKLLVLFSLVWLVITISLLLEDNFVKSSLKILLVKPQHLRLNEWGDFFAGFIAPLAFIWIGFGVYYQKKEFANIVKSFHLQKEEFKKSVDVMKEQVIQIEIQQYNTWFNRNIQSLQNTKNKLFKNIKLQEIDSIFPIYQALQVNIESEDEFFNIFDELKQIVDISENIHKFIDTELEKKHLNIKLENVLLDLKKEVLLLEVDDRKHCKGILKKVYVLISAGTIIDEYKAYDEHYGSWVTNKMYLVDYIKDQNIDEQTRFEDLNEEEIIKLKVKSAFENIDTIDFNIIQGNINGSI